MNQKEQKAALKWMKVHKKMCKQKDVGAIGGRYSFEFTPTSIGMAIAVKCTCGEKENVTDYDCW